MFLIFFIAANQIEMPFFRRCHISCRIESVHAMRGIISHSHFTATNGKHFPIHNMTAAYNGHTKEARIYAEFERVGENVIEDNMHTLGARTIVIDSFSSGDWENASKIAFTSVVQCGSKNGFSLFKHGTEPKAGIRDEPADGGSGGAVNGDDDDDEDQRPRTSGSDGERTKRRRTAFPDGGGPNMISLDVMKAVISATGSAVTSAINSSGQTQIEQQRVAEKKLQEAEMKSVAENAQRAADAQLKAMDDAHAVAMGGLRGELYSKYEEERLKALDEVSAARGKVEEEKSKLARVENDLQELGLSKVV